MARILIVEDEFSDQLRLYSIFQGRGHDVYTARDGEDAFEAYMQRNIELVVTDLQMPKVDGFELIDGMRTLHPDAPIIVISGKGPEMLAQAEAMDVFAVFTKPVDPDELLKAVESATAVRGPGG